MKKSEKTDVGVEAYYSPVMVTIGISSNSICTGSNLSGEHEGIEEDGVYEW